MIGYIIAGAVIILVIAVLFSGYKKAPPDTAFGSPEENHHREGQCKASFLRTDG